MRDPSLFYALRGFNVTTSLMASATIAPWVVVLIPSVLLLSTPGPPPLREARLVLSSRAAGIRTRNLTGYEPAALTC